MKTLKYKNKYLSYIQKQFSKFAVILVVVSMLFGTLDINQTSAYFSDNAVVSGNTFTAGTLAVSISNENVSAVVLPGNNTTTTTTLSKTNSTNLDYQYFVNSTIVGDATACDYITISALNSSKNYPAGLLKSFVSDISTPNGSTQWDFTFTVASDIPTSDLGKICNFKISYNAWQTNLPNNSQGFSDVAEMTGSIQIGQTVQTINPGDVVINELMWSGSSTNSDDEWLELRNMTNHSIDLSGWQLTKKNSDSIQVLMVTIPSGKTILPNGFFLISEFDQAYSAINVAPDLVAGPGSTDSNVFALANDKLQIKLYRSDWNNSSNLIDTADDGVGNPAEGLNDTINNIKKSMERHNIPGDGTLAGSWHTCTDSGCNSGTYWKTASGNNYGTPGGPNLSTNDPTSSDYDPTFVPEEEIIVPEKIVEPEELLPSASLPADDEIFGEAKPEEIPPATEEEVAPVEEQPAEEVVAESGQKEEIVSEESVEEVTVVEPVVEEVSSEPIVEEATEPIVEEVVELVITE